MPSVGFLVSLYASVICCLSTSSIGLAAAT